MSIIIKNLNSIVDVLPCIDDCGYMLMIAFENGEDMCYHFTSKERFLNTHRRLERYDKERAYQDIEKILDKAAKALLENEKERLNGENVEFFVFEEESYKGKDMYYIIQDCNDEFLDEVGSGYMDFSSLKVDTNSVSEVRKFTIIHERDEYTGYVANINGKWRVMEIEMLAWVFDDWGETAIDPLW